MVKLVIIFFCYILKYLSLSISLVLYTVYPSISLSIFYLICEFMVALKDAQLIRYYKYKKCRLLGRLPVAVLPSKPCQKCTKNVHL